MSGIEELAVDLGVSVNEARGFVDCLRIWTDKGHSFEEAIALNLKMQGDLLNRVNDGIHNELSRYREPAHALTTLAVDAFYPQEASA